ncbi:Sip1p NDAI_0H01600 [Naumovozyma dairenensis CBS 421]|uniref:Association with the SNF1 complex (ASC) domain-containing protein n=1 Tax=Naumovozyma dairenensis (strain ATCC 10597 / BCRC 20456 / CBS 421 / NBRC 0211 / NRRL Y-12639) TaxID=1071378 RepID=G0WEX3_NAUDC|nr:hypothetical protein NDAI_0H01600 [Naumovozyma dairenensis CBS 421]CCD26334.1 hypothetical protein NDAI_0H01600 [Naumovozyma dairenensis CBS 421]
MGNNPSTTDSENTAADLQEKKAGFHNKHLTRIQKQESPKERKGSITSHLFSSKGSSKRHALMPKPIEAQGNIKSHNVFKKDYSMDEPLTNKGGIKNNDFNDENIHETMASLSLVTSSDNERKKSMSFARPGPSTPTVQPTKHDITSLEGSTDVNTGIDNMNVAGDLNSHRPSIVALKNTLAESSIHPPSDLSKTVSTSSNCQSFSTESSSSALHKTESIDIPRRHSQGFNENYNETMLKHPTVHSYQYQYFNNENTNNDGGLHKHKENFNDMQLSTSNDDEESGVLQSADIVVNQSTLQNALKRDMKRKRTDTISTNKSGAPTSDALKAKDEPEAKTKTEKPAMSATAAMMLKLYGDTTLKEKETFKNNTISGTIRYDDFYKRSESSVNLPENKKLKSFDNNTKNGNGYVSVSGNPNSGLSNTYNSNSNLSFSSSPRDIKIQHIDDVKTHLPSSFSSSTSSTSSSLGSSAGLINDNVHVVLKWRDQIDNPKKCKIAIISDDIVNALESSSSKRKSNTNNNDNNTLPMVFNPMIKEWYMPNLTLPPGIYRLKFSINNDITHSNFLPTATDSMGNIVNWFEVLPGYDAVEPYRDEIIETTFHTAPSQGTLSVHDLTMIRSRRSSSFVSAKSDLSSFTPYSDYAGISRSSSSVGTATKKASLVSLRGTNKLDLFTPIEPKKIAYSKEIPELFKIANSEDTNKMEIDDDGSSPFERPSFTHKVIDCNQDKLFADLQRDGNIDAETAEALFLNRYPIPDLPIYLNSTYLNKIFTQFQKQHNDPTLPASSSIGLTHIIPHVNLNHLLTSSIRDEIISVACTTRYQGKFITQVMYAPCNYSSQENKAIS